MFRVSTVLKNTREEKDYTYLEVSKKIKVPVKYLEALENEKIDLLPQEPYCSLIVKDYANFLGLNGDEVLSFFRRDFAQKKKTVKPKQIGVFYFTPQLSFKIALTLIVGLFVSYLIYDYLKFNQPPKLSVDWSDTISSDQVDVRGVTDSGSTVRVNGDLVIVDPDGSFHKKVFVNSGDQTQIIVEAKSVGGKTTRVEKIIN